MKRHQRIMGALLLTASLSSPGLAWAEVRVPEQPSPTMDLLLPHTTVTQAQAVAIAKAAFPIPDALGEPSVGFSESRDYAVWRLEWRTKEKAAPQQSFSVEVDAVTGKIRSYSRWQQEASTAALSYTRAEALKLAEAWLEKLGADLKPALRYREVDQGLYYGGAGSSYAFHWDRLEQGYPIRDQGLDISIDARTGELERFSVSTGPKGLTYALPKEIIDRAGAEAAYRQGLPMELHYWRFVKPGTDEARWQLLYRPVTGYAPLVSADGKLTNAGGTEIDFAKYQDQSVVPVPFVPYKKPAQPLDREQALKLARQVSGRTDEPASSDYSEYGEHKQRVWNFAWSGPREADGPEQHTDVRIDAEAGVVLSYYNWTPGGFEPLKEGEEPKLTLEEARQNALGQMLLFRPDLAGAARLRPSLEENRFLEMKIGGRPGVYEVRFVHLQNAIPVSEGESHFQINARTGEIMTFSSYDSRTEKDKLPEPEGLIKPEQALDALLAQQPLELVWTTIYDQKPSAAKEPAMPQVALVWAPAQAGVVGIDAVAGVPLDGAGRNLIEAAKRPTDIEGHFAQREIELLWARGVFELKDGKFNPAESITVEELARWLVLSRGMQPYPMYDFRMGLGGGMEKAAETIANSRNAGYFGAAFQAGIFVPEDFTADLDLNAKASREQFALWAVRALGYGAIAKMSNKVEVSFVDRDQIDAKYANAVGVLQGLGIVKGSGAGTFGPKRLITRAEAAKVLFAITAEPRR